ncbi:PadR family transcriptional regulator [Baia soyae]|uniref:PadR family transcriptional regulator n=1 Tax=Baia soyae TaxID=1544746 RepID=A0A4R2S1C4_9BACL|nr:PadR family transcriptional regulator [Baia soyae]TCP70078.1 PadR family transcriptional regulator [Baia soyae]
MESFVYTILAILARDSGSSFEIAKKMDLCWQTKHNQIYPILVELEERDLIFCTTIPQSGKPDKKVFSITEQGKEALAKWVPNVFQEPIIRDGFLAKIYAQWLLDPDTMVQLLEERMQFFQHKIGEHESEIAQLEADAGASLKDPSSPHFGRYILLMRKLQMEQDESDWCAWALAFYQKEPIIQYE